VLLEEEDEVILEDSGTEILPVNNDNLMMTVKNDLSSSIDQISLKKNTTTMLTNPASAGGLKLNLIFFSFNNLF
jgi:hypothetical protein